jgi:transketolase
MIDLQFVPLDEFARSRALPLSAHAHARLFADLCRINALYMIARAGSGHIGTSFSCLEILSWLYLHELDIEPAGAHDVFFSSKGHDVPALYSVLIATGRLPFDKLHQLRRYQGLPGHPDVATPNIEANTGSLGMGISKAKGHAFANRLKGRDDRVYVLTGDGELQEGQFWESLVSAANHGLAEITAIVDHNKLQSDTYVAKVSDLGALDAKFTAFGWHVQRIDGHDPAEIEQALAAARAERGKPSVIIADTIKGRGVSFMEPMPPASDELYKFHSGAPNDETYLRAIPELIARVNAQLDAAGQPALRTESSPRPPRVAPAEPQRLIAAYGSALVEHAARDERIVAFDADLVLDTGLIPFQKQFPARFVECGIAEQDMVSQAGAAARRGLLPAVHSFACFLSTRPNEQIYNNATERSKVVYVGSLAGLVPAGPGHSHQCVRDISSLGAIPGLVMLEPCNEREVAMAADYCFAGTGASCYLRLVTLPVAVPFELPADYRLDEGRGVTLREGSDCVVIGYGPVLLAEAWKAAAMVQEQHGVSVRLVNLPWLNRVDPGWLKTTIAGASWLFTLDNHYITGGQGDMLLRTLAEHGLAAGIRARRLGVEDVPACGQNDEVLRAHRLDADSLAARIAAAVSLITAD